MPPLRKTRLLFLPSGSKWWKTYLALAVTFAVLLAPSHLSAVLYSVFKVGAEVILLALLVTYYRDRRAHPEDFR